MPPKPVVTKQGYADADDYVRSITDRWTTEGQQITSEETIRQTTVTVATNMAELAARHRAILLKKKP
jgi:hypothetical protein